MGVTEEPHTTLKAIKKIEGLNDELALKQCLTFIRTSNLFQNNGLTRHFSNTFPTRLIDHVDFTKFEIELLLEQNSLQLNEILDKYADATKCALSSDFEQAIQCISQMIELSGVSICLLRLLYFIYNRAEHLEGNSEVLDKVDIILEKIQADNISDLSKGIKQIIVDRADYFPICNRVAVSKIPRNVKHILQTFISHIPLDDGNYFEILNSYLSFSLLDALVYSYSMNKVGYPVKKFILPTNCVNTLDELASVPMNLSFYEDTEGEGANDLSYFREAFLLIELEDNLNYKTIQGAHYTTPANRNRIKRHFESNLIAEYYKDIDSLADLNVKCDQSSCINLGSYKVANCSLAENSAALIYYLEKEDALLNEFEEQQFVKLMSCTTDIAHMAEPEHLATIKNRAKNQDLRIIALCLLTESKQDKCDLTEHEFRKRLQELIKSKHNGSIVEALKSFNDVSPSVTQYLAQTCDETFLSRLFDLNGETNTALETRAEILEWFGKATSDQGAIDRAKNIRINIQINKHIKHIDDSRIYADPTRVIAWINDNYINKMALSLDEIVKTDKPEFNINWTQTNSTIGHVYDLAEIVANCYFEFVSNSLYGVSSYLGRRIRHGTVKGNAVGTVKNILDSSEFEVLKKDPLFMDAWSKWLNEYTQVFDDLVLKYFHIQKKGSTPHGLLSPFIISDFKQKVANTLLDNLYQSYKTLDNVSEAPALIVEYCWRLISEDLQRVKKHLYKKKEQVLKFPKIERKQLKNPKVVGHLIQTLQSEVGEKFKLIDSWFNKPSYASPSAELMLLYKVAIEEVERKSIGFKPTIIEDESDLIIYGEQYFVIFDALEIMIKNVAEHGDKTGLLKFDSSFEKVTKEHSELKITVTSSFSGNLPFEQARTIIEAKMSSNAFSDANLVDRGSGILKLRFMQADKQIDKLLFEYPIVDGQKKLAATFSVRLAH